MKKALLFLLISCLLCSSLTTVFADSIAFPDLPDSHWAHAAVQQLVADGTVRGYEDGTFRPDAKVSRAEFVTMLGRSDVRRETNYADVDESHWGYENIMYSGVQADQNGNFQPDIPMTRGDIVSLLWQRAGNPGNVVAPSIITDQSKDPKAVAWAYMSGLMIGDDGVNLRLQDGISRAEASSLIVRARKATATDLHFTEQVSDELLKTVFQNSRLFEREYVATETVTNGELARATVRLASEEYQLSYSKFSYEMPFEHPYAPDLYILGTKCLGEDKINATFADQKATIQDMIAALTFGAIKKSHQSIGYDVSGAGYIDATASKEDLAYTCLTFAYKNGVQLFAGGKIHPNQTATMRDIATVLLQLDYKIGFQSSYAVGQQFQIKDVSMKHNLNTYPTTAPYFGSILEELPNEVYTVGFDNMEAMDGSYGENPAALYNFAREYYSLFVSLLDQERQAIKTKTGADIRFTFYPSLVCNNQTGFTVRVKTEIVSLNNKQATYKEVFPGTAKNNPSLYEGMTFFQDIYMDYTLASDPQTKVVYGQLAVSVK